MLHHRVYKKHCHLLTIKYSKLNCSCQVTQDKSLVEHFHSWKNNLPQPPHIENMSPLKLYNKFSKVTL